MLVINVTINQHTNVILRDILSQNIMVSSILVISVTSNLHGKVILENILSISSYNKKKS